jgi:N-acetylglucosaminyl-diphospho-decaprenol L-rhamnosyltransferase
MDLSIIIVNWNSAALLKQCLTSVFWHTRHISFEVVVIDSGSYDGCDTMLARDFPLVHFIQSRQNLGFARANNRALQDSTGDHVLFLNPDTQLVGTAINLMLAQIASRPGAGAVGCRLLNSDGTVQTSCIQSYPTLLNQLLDSNVLRAVWPKSRLWGMAPLFEASCGAEPVEAISGACLLVRRDAYERVGRFNEEYFMYAEDIDLCYRLNQAGYTNYYVPEASVIHHGGSSSEHATSDFAAVMMPEAIWKFLRKTRGRLYGAAYRAGMLVSAVTRVTVLALLLAVRWFSTRRGRLKSSFAKWCAVLRWSLNAEASLRPHC